MKKLIAISILLTVLTAGAFAQFKVGLGANFYPDLLKATSPTGDAMEDDVPNGYPYGGTGTFDFLSSMDTWNGSDVDLSLAYNDPDGKYAGFVQLNAQNWFRALLPESYDTEGGGALADQADGQADSAVGTRSRASALSFLDVPIGDWYLWGNVGILNAYVGNTDLAGRGKVDRYTGAFSNLFDHGKQDNYGILMFGVDAGLNNTITDVGVGFNALDIDNIGKTTDPWSDSPSNWNNAYFALTADFAPISVAVAGDMSAAFTKMLDPDLTQSYSAVGAGLRVSGDKIADLITFDAVYKIVGWDPDNDVKQTHDATTGLTTTPNRQPDGAGRWDHSFGIFANLGLLNDTLGIGVGYSGYTRAQEDLKVNSNTYKYVYPYFNGIDLRFQFTGVDRLTVDFNNNISFSTITNDTSDKTILASLMPFQAGSGVNAEKYIGPYPVSRTNGELVKVTQGYFGMYNALGVKFGLTDQLSAIFNLGNKIGIFNYTDGSNEADVRTYDFSVDQLIATLSVGYSFTSHVSLESGLAFQIDNYSYKTSESSQKDLTWGQFTFGIPVYFKVSF
jgi:hypothetical protein